MRLLLHYYILDSTEEKCRRQYRAYKSNSSAVSLFLDNHLDDLVRVSYSTMVCKWKSVKGETIKVNHVTWHLPYGIQKQYSTYRICSNGRHGYNYFQVQQDAASIRGWLPFEVVWRTWQLFYSVQGRSVLFWQHRMLSSLPWQQPFPVLHAVSLHLQL